MSYKFQKGDAKLGGAVDAQALSGSLAASSLSSLDTDDLSEGSTNLYYADSLARAAVSVTDAGGDGSMAYDSGTGVFTYTGPSASEVRAHLTAGDGLDVASGEFSLDLKSDGGLDIQSTELSIADLGVTNAMLSGGIASGKLAELNAFDTDALSEGSSNQYFTSERARKSVSVVDAGGDGSLTYVSGTGVFTYTGPSAAEVRAHLTAGAGLDVADGEFSLDLKSGGGLDIQSTELSIADLGVTNAMLAADAVDGTKIADDSVDSEHIALGALDAEHYSSGSVQNGHLAGGIANAKLVNDSVTLTAGVGMAAIGEVALGASITVAVDGVLEDLDTLGAPIADGEFIVATGAGAFAYESGDTARTSLGLGTGDSPSFTAVSASNGFATNGVVQAGEVQASTFSGDSVAVTGITGSLNNALSAGDGIADFTYDNGDGPKTVALDLKSDDGLQIADGQLAVKVDNRSFSLTAGRGIELASAVAGEGLSLSSGVLSAVHAVNTTDTNQDFNVAYGVNAQILGMSGAVTASLPTIASGDEGKVVIIKVSNADVNTVRVQAGGSQKIDNSTDDILIESNAGALTLVALGATAGWAII